jgi:hypothetical protein
MTEPMTSERRKEIERWVRDNWYPYGANEWKRTALDLFAELKRVEGEREYWRERWRRATRGACERIGDATEEGHS